MNRKLIALAIWMAAVPAGSAEDYEVLPVPDGGDSGTAECETAQRADREKPMWESADGAAAHAVDVNRQALALARKWMLGSEPAVLGENGQIRFTFGAALPVIVCAPLRTTDIALQPGEVIRADGVHIGDSVRWQVMPSTSGPSGNETTHLIVKPTDQALATNIIIATDRRTYHLELLSTKTEWMPSVGFNYPEERIAQWEAYHRRASESRSATTLTNTGESIHSLDFDYIVEGQASWKPLRVYNNGAKTILQMPAAMKAAEAPALIVLSDSSQEEMVNYRIKGDRFVVDTVFDKAVLVLGVGRKQSRITIERMKK